MSEARQGSLSSGMDAIFKQDGNHPVNIDMGLLRCGLIAEDHAQEPLTDTDAYKRDIRYKSYLRLEDPAFQGALLGATDLQDLALKSPFFYTLNILEVGEVVNRSFGYGLIADQCRRYIKTLKRNALALDGIPSEFWGTIPEVYEKESAKFAEENRKKLDEEIKLSDGDPLKLFYDPLKLFRMSGIFSGPDLKKGIFWYADQMAYGRVKIAPIEWNCGLVQENFERALEETISTFKATGLRDAECHVPLMTRLAYRFGFG